jgi:UDP-glucose 4-epimerase
VERVLSAPMLPKTCLKWDTMLQFWIDLSGGFPENVPDGYEFVEGSIVDDELVERIFKSHKCEIIYHLAAYAAEGLSHFIRRYNYTNNLIGSVTIVNAAIRNGTGRLVFTSSIAVYGTGQLPMREDMVPLPEDPYGIAKRAVELDLQAAAHMFGIEYVIFRPHNVYGERQNIGDPYRNVIGIFMNKIMKGEPMPIFGDGSQTRAFSYIGDVAPIIVRGGFEPKGKNEIFNVGADEPITVVEVAHMVAETFDVEPRIIRLPKRDEVLHAFSDHTTVRKMFGETQKIPLREGLKRMAAWVQLRGPQEPRLFTEIEVTQCLPESWKALNLKI